MLQDFLALQENSHVEYKFLLTQHWSLWPHVSKPGSLILPEGLDSDERFKISRSVPAQAGAFAIALAARSQL